MVDRTKLGKLATFNLQYTDEDLRGTPFYSKRDTITAKQLSNKPTYRCMGLLKKVGDNNFVLEIDDFLYWVQLPIDDYDEQFQAVKNFRRSYGHFKAMRYLLTVKNAVELYMNTHD